MHKRYIKGNQSISLQKIIKSQRKAAREEEMNKGITNWLEKINKMAILRPSLSTMTLSVD